MAAQLACVAVWAAAGVRYPSLAHVRAARKRCEHDPDAEIGAASVARWDGLRVNCQPPRDAPPCISEAYFHSRASTNVNWLGEGGGPRDYAMCARRHSYADWPTIEPYVPLNRRPGDGRTHTMADILALLGPDRKMLVVGASTARQFHDATLCALAGSGSAEEFTARRKQVHVAWANKYADASGGCGWEAAQRACAARNVSRPSFLTCDRYARKDRCVANGTAFGARLDRYDLVLAAFDPQHYGGTLVNLAEWEIDMAYMLIEIDRWLSRHAGDPAKAAFVREPSSLHFAGGEYATPPAPAPGANGTAGGAGAGAGPKVCKCWRSDEAWAHHNKNWAATAILHRHAAKHPRVHLVPFYNASLLRYNMHKGDMCSYRLKRVGGKPVPSGAPRRRRALASLRPIRRCCDCLHLCYSPAFYDATFYSPMYDALVSKHGYGGGANATALLPPPAPTRRPLAQPAARRGAALDLVRQRALPAAAAARRR